MLVLCLDSSDRLLKTALFEDDKILAEAISDSMGNHSEKIILQIDELLKKSGKDLHDLRLLAINTGPGSFTGLRIGASAMAGLAISRDIPLLGFNGFEIMREDISGSDGSYLFVVHCRGDEFYYLYLEISDGPEAEKIEPKIAAADKLGLELDESEIVLLGPGKEKFLEICSDDLGQIFQTENQIGNCPTMNSLAKLALRRLKSDPEADFGIPEIYYMAPSQAEVNYARRKGRG